MNTVKFDKKETKIIAHRGLSGIEKENTNAAFVAAGNRSYYGIETDVHKTLDGKYVVFHDDTTGRVAIDDMEVEKTTFDCLRNLLLTDIDGKKGRTDIRIPTLQEYISICKKYEKVAVLELKNAFTEDEVYEIVDIIKDLGYLPNVVFISFCLENLIFLRKKYPVQPAQFLTDSYDDGLIASTRKRVRITILPSSYSTRFVPDADMVGYILYGALVYRPARIGQRDCHNIFPI